MDFPRRHACFGFLGSTNSGGCMYKVFCKLSWRKTFFTSNWCIDHYLDRAKLSFVCIVAGLIYMIKSLVTIYSNLLTITIDHHSSFIAFKRTIKRYLCLNIYMPRITLIPLGRGTIYQVLFLIKAGYSSCKASFQLGSRNATKWEWE